ncbi:MAG: hypothetical protein IIZ38_11065 [Sphingomonas sp.]|uniref:hypothetical protein n=1 Tax=Sphingomonas sp. TaxID=28214 RepID=UPI0025D8FA0A|nr:hypothetical protein [Sphingomonas sp.]MBQ1498843.1 hypothetical protein [Sphingomonas sp.]MBQ8106672.1 hypothetical protein [Afipia sp.]
MRSLQESPNAIEHLANRGVDIAEIQTNLITDSDWEEAEWRQPLAALDRSIRGFYEPVGNWLVEQRVSDRDIEALKTALGASTPHRKLPAEMLASNRWIRRQGFKLLKAQTHEMWQPAGTRRRWFFITLITDIGNALEYAPVIEIKRLKTAFGKILRASGLHSFAVLEFQGGTNFPQGGEGRTIMAHAHAIGFTDDEEFDAEHLESRLREQSTLHNWLGAPTIKIVPVPSRDQLHRRCSYLFKAPIRGCFLSKNDWKKSGFEILKTDISPEFSVRLAELLCQLNYSAIVFSTGGGNTIKTPWLRALRKWHTQRAANHVVDYAAIWRKVWAASCARTTRQPFDIRYNATLKLSTAWQEAISAYRERVERAREEKKAAKRRPHASKTTTP